MAVENHLADIEVSEVGRFEEAWLRFVQEAHGEILETIRKEEKLTDEIRTSLDKAAEEFKERFAG